MCPTTALRRDTWLRNPRLTLKPLLFSSTPHAASGASSPTVPCNREGALAMGSGTSGSCAQPPAARPFLSDPVRPRLTPSAM